MIITEASKRILDKNNPLGVVLYSYQRATISVMEQLENPLTYIENCDGGMVKPSFGFLGNKVGSGKTNIILSLAKRNKFSILGNDYKYTSIYNNNIVTTIKYGEGRQQWINSTLVIVPHNIFNQWVKSIEKTKTTFKLVNKPEDFDITDCEDYDVILCSTTKFNKLFSLYDLGKIIWNRVIIDEAASMGYIKFTPLFRFCWLVSADYRGTIDFGRNSYNACIKKIINNLGHEDENVRESMLVRCSDEFIDSRMVDTEIIKNTIICRLSKFLTQTTDFVSNDIRNMINGGDIKGAILALGGSSENSDSIIDLLNKNTQLSIDKKKHRIEYLKNISKERPEIVEEKIKKENDDIKTLERRLLSISENLKGIKDDTCCICLDEFKEPVIIDCCDNIFCFLCLNDHFQTNNKCPLCRKNSNDINLTHIDTGNSNVANDDGKLLSKQSNTVNIIKNNPSGKFLIFSNYNGSFDDLLEKFNDNNITHEILKGSSLEIPRIIKKFNNGKFSVLMLNSINYGAGINLEETTDIIIYHRITDALEKQTIGRALRADRGPDLPLNIHYLLYEGE